jgi:hypothetical protein
MSYNSAKRLRRSKLRPFRSSDALRSTRVIQVGLIVESSNVTGAGRLLRGASLSLLAKFRRFRNADRRLRPSWPADLAKNGEFSVSGCKASANPRNSRAFSWRPEIPGLAGLRGWGRRIRTSVWRNQNRDPALDASVLEGACQCRLGKRTETFTRKIAVLRAC